MSVRKSDGLSEFGVAATFGHYALRTILESELSRLLAIERAARAVANASKGSQESARAIEALRSALTPPPGSDGEG